MSLPLRLALIAITFALLIMSLGRGTPQGRMLMAQLLAPALTEIQPLLLTHDAPPAPARLVERVRSDLTAPWPDAGPGQATSYVTMGGLRWWGIGPETGDPAPAILLLHDSGQDGRAMIDMWHGIAARQGVVLIAPDFPADGTAPYDARIAAETLAHAGQVFRLDAERVGLFGHGRGAETAQLWANSIAGPWDAVVAHAGIVGTDAPRPVGEGVPVRHYLGSDDPARPVAQALASATAMARAGHPYDLIRLRGHDNDLAANGPRIAEDAWVWLETRLPPRPAP
ncbi:dienelactone hydrolase family protein [Jannaschia formosa]|uniref:dienelactone hydrolase family protein n=1 Tax=Jannaschia formosa TaxID=2259592 RepID=UPI000E1BBB6A|nr:hypothetical protein [Jannaschia formosa]TFL18800.1 hypothetical protein DR046_07705 [Jannaschia formosa]